MTSSWRPANTSCFRCRIRLRHDQRSQGSRVRAVLHHQGAWKGHWPGLSQVYGFSRQCGGTARIESKRGKGTTVRIYLPRAEGEISEHRSLNDLSRASTCAGRYGRDPHRRGPCRCPTDHQRGAVASRLSRLDDDHRAPKALAILQQENSMRFCQRRGATGGVSGIELARTARTLKPSSRSY